MFPRLIGFCVGVAIYAVIIGVALVFFSNGQIKWISAIINVFLLTVLIFAFRFLHKLFFDRHP